MDPPAVDAGAHPGGGIRARAQRSFDGGRRQVLALAAGSGMAAWAPWPVQASRLPPLAGSVLLTVSRSASPGSNPGAHEVHFDRSRLAALPQHSLTTRTPWFEGPRRFTGPLLRGVLEAAGIVVDPGMRLRATALNDYRVEIPASDLIRWPVVLARLIDGQPLTVRQKGPLFVMYPFDDFPRLANATYLSRCIWQLRHLQVR